MGLKVEFVRYGNMLCATILEQREKDRNALAFSHRGYWLIAQDYPRINGTTLYVRGVKKARDYRIARCSYNTVKQAKEALEGFKAAIEAYNASLLPEWEQQASEATDIETVIVG